MGRKLEPVVVDPASNWPLFAEKARQLLTKDKVSVVFGCWTSVSRKSVLPVFEELNGLLFYPVQYEGEEMSRNVFYTGAAPNQQAIPAVEYLMSKEGGGAKRWVLVGFVSVVTGVMPHNGKRTATIESLFALPSHRKYGIGDALLSAVEVLALKEGCVALLYTARVGSPLSVVLSRRPGCKESHTMFTRWL